MLSPLLVAAITAIIMVPAATAQAPSSAKTSPDIEAARTALAKYADPFAAIREGYFSTLGCIDFPNGGKDGPVEYPPGAMGVHFLNPANIGPKLEPTKPQVLIYEQVGNKLVLAGAEWFVPAQVVGDGPAPSIFGQALAGPMDGHEPIIPKALRHYDLHVWLWKDNPRGMFSSTNANIKCTPGSPYYVALGDENHKH